MIAVDGAALLVFLNENDVTGAIIPATVSAQLGLGGVRFGWAPAGRCVTWPGNGLVSDLS